MFRNEITSSMDHAEHMKKKWFAWLKWTCTFSAFHCYL